MEILVSRQVLKMYDASQPYSYVERVNLKNKSSEYGILKSSAGQKILSKEEIPKY